MPSLVLLSLPPNAAPGQSGDPETRLHHFLETEIGCPNGVNAINLPDLKIGMLDNLVQQAEDVAKIDQQVQSLVNKTHELVLNIFQSDEQQVKRAELIDNQTPLNFMQHFKWNHGRYRLDRSIQSLLETLSGEAFSCDQDLKTRIAAYQQTKQQLAQLDRKRSGDLSVRSLDDVVKPTDLVKSEYLTTVLVAVPKRSRDQFIQKYEQISEMVVPRSAIELAQDTDYILYSVTVFKKFVSKFEQRVRENQWVPRDPPKAESPNPDEHDSHANIDQIRSVEVQQRKELLKLASVAFGDIVRVLGHIKAIRVFVESVLRYGLPVKYLTASFEVTNYEKCEKRLMQEFAYLGKGAVKTDSKGRVHNEDLTEFGGLVEQDYKPFVVYQVQLP